MVRRLTMMKERPNISAENSTSVASEDGKIARFLGTAARSASTHRSAVDSLEIESIRRRRSAETTTLRELSGIRNRLMMAWKAW